MRQEKFIKEVEKNLNCTTARKKQILQELKADIDAAGENGESWEETEKRMGQPADLAAEFNENMNAAGKPNGKVKKVLLILAVIAAVLALLAGAFWWYIPKSYPIGTSGVFAEETVAAESIELIELLNAGDYEVIQARSIEELKPYLTEDQWQTVWEQLGGEPGAFQKFGSEITVEVKEKGKLYAVTEVVAVYENYSVTYHISFDKDMKLAGIYLR